MDLNVLLLVLFFILLVKYGNVIKKNLTFFRLLLFNAQEEHIIKNEAVQACSVLLKSTKVTGAAEIT